MRREVQYQVNEELTAAVMEEILKKKIFLDELAAAGGDPYAVIFGSGEQERFCGTAVNEEAVEKMRRINDLLDVVGTGTCISVQKCETPNPRSNSAVFAVNFLHGVNALNGTGYKAFREITRLTDEMIIVPKEGRSVRIAFTLGDIWKGHRELDDFELAELDRDMFDDLEDAEDEADPDFE